MSTEEKTEKPTPQKVKENRKEGRVPRTTEIGGWASMLVFALLLTFLVKLAARKLQELTVTCLRVVENAEEDKALALLGDGLVLALLITLALGVGVLLISAAAAISQGGLHLATKSLKPKLSRLSLIQGGKRLFGTQALWMGAKLVLKASVVALLIWRGIEAMLPLLGGLVPMHVVLGKLSDTATGMLRDVAIAGLVAGAADYLVQRRQTGKQTRMTKKEVMDEHKRTEGDPLIKSAIRSRQLAAARGRMMADVPTADVLLVNPVHVAVALKYDPAKGSPRVVAKGAGAVAAKIRAVAEEARVPLVQDIPLARALHSSCEVGQQIPPELYHAVAQVLAFVMSRKARGVAAGRHNSPRTDPTLPEVPRAGRRRPAVASAGPDSSGAAPASR